MSALDLYKGLQPGLRQALEPATYQALDQAMLDLDYAKARTLLVQHWPEAKPLDPQ